MNKLTQSVVDRVRSALKGARLAKFDASIAVLNESLTQGGWIKRGSVKANSGFYQGLCRTNFHRNYSARGAAEKAQELALSLDFCLMYGQSMKGDLKLALKTLREGTQEDGTPVKLKLDDQTIEAWVDLCAEYRAAKAMLDDARPLPTITPIGLSPKVTKTLTECNLDLDLPSIRMADLDFKWVPGWKWDKKLNQLVKAFDRDGKRIMVKYWFVKWTPGIVHNQSRFTSGCHACGKHIPSGRFVAIEAQDKRSGKLVSMWIGCDCARNIFGIKDIGIAKDAKEQEARV